MATNTAKIPTPISARFEKWAQRVALGRKLAIALTLAAVASSLATYAALTGWAPLRTDIKTMLILLNLDLALFLILAAIVARGLVQVTQGKANAYQDLFWALLNSNEFIFVH